MRRTSVMDIYKNKLKANQIAYVGILAALTLALSAVEWLIPMPLPPGVRLGLANIPIMLTGWKKQHLPAAALAIVKVSFVFITRGAMAGANSLGGTVLSFAVLILLLKKDNRFFPAVFAGIAHNIGQISVMSFVLGSFAFYYLPMLVLSGAAMGIITGTIFKLLTKVNKIGY